MKPLMEFGLDSEVVRILGHEGIQDEILDALQRASSRKVVSDDHKDSLVDASC